MTLRVSFMKLKKIRSIAASIPVIGPILKSIYQSLKQDPAPKPDARTELLNTLPKGARCAEIGVWKGDFSERILRVTKPQRLVLVDPWEFVPSHEERWYGGKIAKSQADMDATYEGVVERFASHPEVEVARHRSVDFLAKTDVEFDWVYIDGDHSEDPVYRDLTLSWERVVPGGHVCGDDYYWKDADGTLAVKKAVDRFVSEKGCRIRLFDGQFILDR